MTKPRCNPSLLFMLAIATLLLLTACKAEVNVTIDEEDTGEIEIIVAVNDAIMSLVRMSGDSPFEDFLDIPADELEADGLEEAIIQPYSAAGYTGIKIRATFDPYDPTLAAVSQTNSMLGNLTDTIGIGQFQFTRTEEDDGWIVKLDQSTDPRMTDGLDALAGDIPFDFDDLDLPFTFSLKLPGEYVEHNASREVDGVLIWDANLTEGIDISVVSRDTGLQFAIVPIAITAFFILIFGGIVIGVVVSRERRRRRAEEDAALEASGEQQIGADSSM